MHACHKVYEIKYHMCFVVKYRKDLFLKEKYVEHMKNVMLEIEKRYYIATETIGFDEDHVHILVQAAPRYSPSRVVQIVKSLTAREQFAKFPEIKKELWGGEFWTDGYYIATVSGRGSKKIIENYIINQGREQDVKQLRLFEL